MKTTVDHIPPLNVERAARMSLIVPANHRRSRPWIWWADNVGCPVMFAVATILLILGAAHALPWQS